MQGCGPAVGEGGGTCARERPRPGMGGATTTAGAAHPPTTTSRRRRRRRRAALCADALRRTAESFIDLTDAHQLLPMWAPCASRPSSKALCCSTTPAHGCERCGEARRAQQRQALNLPGAAPRVGQGRRASVCMRWRSSRPTVCSSLCSDALHACEAKGGPTRRPRCAVFISAQRAPRRPPPDRLFALRASRLGLCASFAISKSRTSGTCGLRDGAHLTPQSGWEGSLRAVLLRQRLPPALCQSS